MRARWRRHAGVEIGVSGEVDRALGDRAGSLTCARGAAYGAATPTMLHRGARIAVVAPAGLPSMPDLEAGIGLAVGWTAGVSLAFAMVGFVMGLWLWLAWRTTRGPSGPVSPWQMGVWGAGIFYFVCHLFGFQQVVGGVLLAGLVGFSASGETTETEAPHLDLGLLLVAVATLFGVSMSRSMALFPFVIITILCLATGSAYLWLTGAKTNGKQAALAGLGAVFLLAFINEARVQLSLALNQTLLSAPASSPTTLLLQASGYGWLTWLGYLTVGALIWWAGSPRGAPSTSLRRGLVSVAFVSVMVVAVVSSAAYSLWRTANALQSINNAHYAADLAYESAERVMPWAIELRTDRLQFLRTPIGQRLGHDLAPLDEALLALDPFLNNRFQNE